MYSHSVGAVSLAWWNISVMQATSAPMRVSEQEAAKPKTVEASLECHNIASEKEDGGPRTFPRTHAISKEKCDVSQTCRTRAMVGFTCH